MEAFLSTWLIPTAALVIGLGLGFALGRIVPGSTAGKVQQRLEDLQEQFSDYQHEVVTHFNTTASLVKKLTKSYQDVQDHLNSSANRLALDEITRQRLIAALKSEAPKPKRETPASTEAPKDYAPKDPNAPGALSGQSTKQNA